MSLNFKYWLFFILAIFLSYSNSISAAPAPEFFVVNEKTGECSIFWSGDEFSQEKLPKEWKILQAVHEIKATQCNFETENETEFYQKCCSKLGYEFKEFEGRGITKQNVNTEDITNNQEVAGFFKILWEKILVFFERLFV